MNEVIELSKNMNKKHLVIIEDERTVLSTIIKENFYNLLRKNKTKYLVLETNKKDGKYFVEKYDIKEFPSVLYFNNNRLVHISKGFCYHELHSDYESWYDLLYNKS